MSDPDKKDPGYSLGKVLLFLLAGAVGLAVLVFGTCLLFIRL